MTREALKICLTNEDLISQKKSGALDTFLTSIKTNATRRSYLHYVKRIIFSCESMLEGHTLEELADSFIQKSKVEPEWTKNILMAYLNIIKQRCKLEKTDKDYLNPSSIPNHFKSIKKFLDSNEIEISFRAIKDNYPEQDNLTESRAYTREEINLMIQNSRDSITKFSIYVMSSSGIRKGAWDDLTWGDFKTVYKIISNDEKPKYKTELKDNETGEIVCGALVVYRATKEQYIALISYEAWAEGEACKTIWARKMHKKPTDKDPLLIKKGGIPITSANIRDRIYDLLSSNQLRKLKDGKRKYDVPLLQGFRRYFNRVFSDNQEGSLGQLVIRESD